MFQPQVDRVGAGRRGDFIDKRFDRKRSGRTLGIPEMGRAQRRRRVEKAGDHVRDCVKVPEAVGRRANAPVGEFIGPRGVGYANKLRRQEIAGTRRLCGDLVARKGARDELQRGHFSLRVQGRDHVADDCGSLRAPRRHVAAHPLQAHRPADRLRQQHGIGHRIFEAGATVRSGVLDPDDPDLVDRPSQKLRNRLLQRVRLLCARPDRRQTVHADVRDRTSGPHRRVRLERELVARFQLLRRVRQRRRDVAHSHRFPRGLRNGRAHVMIEVLLFRKHERGSAPRHLQRLRRANRRPFGFGDDPDKVPLDHGFHVAGNPFD